MSFFDEIYEEGLKRAKGVAWVLSDLQLPGYEDARRNFFCCMDDYVSLGNPAEMIWYLGDATQGWEDETNEKIARMQEEAFVALDRPLCFTPGNHDTDYPRWLIQHGIDKPFHFPFYEIVQSHPDWHTTSSIEETHFSLPFHGHRVFFLCDHMAKDGKWLSTHCSVRFGEEYYPYGDTYWKGVRDEMANCGVPVITAAHCAFPGGNRETGLYGKMLPLPLNVRLHFYGHGHIGDYMVREKTFSTISWVDWQDIPQIDVASMENERGAFCRSAILQIYEDDSMGVFFRNHETHRFVSAFFPPRDTSEREGGYETAMEKYEKK